MRDDWRLRVQFADEPGARQLTDRLEALELAHDLQKSFRDRVIVSRDGAVVFCYTDSRAQAEAAGRAVESVATEHGWRAIQTLERWHPVAEQWESPDEDLPSTATERAQEHAERIESEREESAAQGYPVFEVRISCPSREDARVLAERLESEGIPTVHRWHFVVLGAPDEDSARRLADRVRSEAPPGTSVTAEASVQEIASDAPGATPFSPFAVFGGLAG